MSQTCPVGWLFSKTERPAGSCRPYRNEYRQQPTRQHGQEQERAGCNRPQFHDSLGPTPRNASNRETRPRSVYCWFRSESAVRPITVIGTIGSLSGECGTSAVNRRPPSRSRAIFSKEGFRSWTSEEVTMTKRSPTNAFPDRRSRRSEYRVVTHDRASRRGGGAHRSSRGSRCASSWPIRLPGSFD